MEEKQLSMVVTGGIVETMEIKQESGDNHRFISTGLSNTPNNKQLEIRVHLAGVNEQMKKLRGSYHEYDFWKALLFFIVPLLLNASYFHIWAFKSVVAFILPCLSLIISICVILYCCVYYTFVEGGGIKLHSTQEIKIRLCSSLSVKPVSDFREYDRKYALDMDWYGAIAWGFSIYNAIAFIIYWLSYDNWCDFSENNEERSNGHCLIQGSLRGAIMYLLWAFVLVYCAPRLSSQSLLFCKETRDDLLDRYKHTKMSKMFDHVNQELQYWTDSKKIVNRKLEVVTVIVFCAVVLEFGMSVSVRSYLWKNASINEICGAILMKSMNTVMMATCFYQANSMIVHRQSFFSVIMSVLSEPLCCDCADDLLAWWELRNYYIDCDIMIRSMDMTVTFIFLLVGTVLFVLMFVLGIVFGSAAAIVIGAGGNAYWLVLVVVSCQHAATYHNLQLQHVGFIEREHLRMSRKNIKIESEFVEIMKREIINNDRPIKIFSVKINSTFMLLVRTYAVSLVVYTFVQLVM